MGSKKKDALVTMNQQPSGKTREEIAAAYKSEPWWYDLRGFFILTFAYNSTLWQQLRFFGPNFGSKHLELACGTGTMMELMLRWRRWNRLPLGEVVGVDYAEAMLAGAIHRFRRRPDLKFLHGDAADLPFPANTFDTVNIANSVHCFPEVDKALKGVWKVMKPDGVLAANVLLYPRGYRPLKYIAERINTWGMKKGILYTPYHQEDIVNKFLKAGFHIESQLVSGNCLNIRALKSNE